MAPLADLTGRWLRFSAGLARGRVAAGGLGRLGSQNLAELGRCEDFGVGAEGEQRFGRGQRTEMQSDVDPSRIPVCVGRRLGVQRRRRGQVGFVDAQEPGQDFPPDADRDGYRRGDVIDTPAQDVPHAGQLHAVAPPGRLVEDGGGQSAIGTEQLRFPRWSATRYQTPALLTSP
jgi:hypothetical protein